MEKRIIRKITGNEVPQAMELTLNSSPYGLPFYLRLGFFPLSEEQEINGIRFTPMKYVVKKSTPLASAE